MSGQSQKKRGHRRATHGRRAKSNALRRGGALLPSARECRILFQNKQLSERKPKKYSMCKWLRSRDYLNFKNEGRPQRDYGMLSFMSPGRRSARHERNMYKRSMKREAALYGDAMHADDDALEKELNRVVKAGILTPTQAMNYRDRPEELRLMALLKFPKDTDERNARTQALTSGVEEDLNAPTATSASIRAAAQKKGHFARVDAAARAAQKRRRAMQN